MALLEVIGIASILPFMQLVAEPDAIFENKLLNEIYLLFGFESQRSMLIASGITVLVLMTAAGGLTVFIGWLQHKFAWDIAHNLSVRLIATYLNKPYGYYLTHNTSDLLSNMILEIGQITTGVIIAFIELIARSMVTLVIFALLIVVDPKLAIVVLCILGTAYAFIYVLRRRFLSRLGKERLDVNLRRFRSLNEAFVGIKTLRVYGAREYFYDRFFDASKHFSTIQPRVYLVLNSARYFIEMLAFGGILAITLYLLISSRDLKNILPLLSLYALAGYRLLPALQKAFTSAANLRHSFPVVEKLHEDLRVKKQKTDLSEEEKSIKPFSREMRIENLGFSYENNEQPVIHDLNVGISKGQTIAFVGTTGAGKTTLVDLIVGLLPATKGNIKIDDVILAPSNARYWQEQIGYVPQEVFLFDDTVARNIAIGEKDDEIDEERMHRVAKIANVHTFITSELPDGYETAIGERGIRLSGGQRQRLGMARALYRMPALLLLDEATSALDSITESNVIEALKKSADDLTVIIIAHRLSTVRHADHIYLLEYGKIIAEGTYEELHDRSVLFREMVQHS